jgi:ferredoxin
MIFYFSGTGNSLYAAKNIAGTQGEPLLSIAKEFDKEDNLFEYKFNKNELLSFVFPVYAWAPPKIVLDFINRMKITGEKPYVFSLCTCGEEEGNTTHILQKSLAGKGLSLDSAFSMEMPNNYIIGFDVDPKEVEIKKLKNAELTMQEVNNIIKKRQKGIFRIIPGKFPTLKSAIINPFFNRFALSTKMFYATDECTRCGICEKVCPLHTIKIEEKPVWSKACTQCLACINSCPVQAIQCGKGTARKGRYLHPELKNQLFR